jgi:hypothetical protein
MATLASEGGRLFASLSTHVVDVAKPSRVTRPTEVQRLRAGMRENCGHRRALNYYSRYPDGVYSALVAGLTGVGPPPRPDGGPPGRSRD